MLCLHRFGVVVVPSRDRITQTALDRDRQRWFEATGEIAARLLAGDDPAAVWALVAQKASALTGADSAFVALPEDPDAPGDEVRELIVSAIARSGAHRPATVERLPLDGSSSGQVFHTREPLSLDRLEMDPGIDESSRSGPALVLPLRALDRVTGILVVVRAPGRPVFSPDELEFAAAFADQAAVTLELGHTQRHRRELDVLSDRDRIARELHDRVIKQLFDIGISLQGTLHSVRAPAVHSRLIEIVERLQTTINGIQSAIFDLHGGPVETVPLRHRLDAVINEATGGLEIDTSVRIAGPLSEITDALAEHAETVLAAALNNIVRHTAAHNIHIDIQVTDNLVIEVVDDDGDTDRDGWEDLADRGRDLPGLLTVHHLDRGGTRLRWTSPLHRPPILAQGDGHAPGTRR